MVILVAEIDWVGLESGEETVLWRAGAKLHIRTEVVLALLAVPAQSARYPWLYGNPVTWRSDGYGVDIFGNTTID